MMVYALILYVTTVLGERSLSVSCVADVLVKLNTPLLLEYTSYAMMTPLGSEGGLHEMVSCTASWVADRSDTGPGTVVCKMHMYVYNQHALAHHLVASKQ